MGEDFDINNGVFGARAEVLISHDGSLRNLASKLTDRLFHTAFYFDTDMVPPHAELAMCEALGFEVWLNHSEKVTDYNYKLRMETSHCAPEIMNDRMLDISPWLARYVREIGEIVAVISV